MWAATLPLCGGPCRTGILNRVLSLPATDDGSASHPRPGQAEVQVRSEPVQHASELA
jgi:hypothetical protein